MKFFVVNKLSQIPDISNAANASVDFSTVGIFSAYPHGEL